MNPADHDMPKALRWTMEFINRVGFPIFAFIVLAYLCFVSLGKLERAVTENTRVLTVLCERLKI